MKRKTGALGAVLLLSALYLYSSPTVASALLASIGPAATEAVLQRNSVVSIAPLNYSFLATKLSPGDSLSVSITSNPGNVDVLLMNQGNFSQWTLAGRGSYSTYPQSMLHASNYSFAFTSQEAAQDFYVVLVSHSTNQQTNVLAQTTVTRPSQFASFFFPVVFGIVGVVALGYAFGVNSRKKSMRDSVSPINVPTRVASMPAPLESARCRHCGAALGPETSFCPVCGKSQI